MKRLPLFILMPFMLWLQPLRAQIMMITVGAEGNARSDVRQKPEPAQPADTSFVGVKVGGIVADMGGRAIPFASVTLLNRKTHSIYGASTSKFGFFTVEVPAGRYTVEASHVGYEKASAQYDIESFTRIDTLRLRVSVEQLAAITVRADNIRYNPKGYVLDVGENPLYKGYDLTDVLSTAPGLTVTDDGIRSFEKQIRTVYIDERPVKFSGQTLMHYLRSRRAENIRTIEVVTDSGVEEDAAVMGGAVLRITTNRLDNGGFGTARAGTMLGRTRKNLFANASADMRTGKFSLYSFLTLPGYYNTRSRSENLTENRLDGTSSRSESARTNIKRFTDIGASIGLGYDFNPRNLLTVEGSYSFDRSPASGSALRTSSLGATTLDAMTEILTARSRGTKANATLYYVNIFADKSRLTASAEYNYRDDSNDRLYAGTLAGTGAWADSDATRRGAENYGASVKYSRPVRGNHGSLAAGAKYSFVNNSTLRDAATSDAELSLRPAQHYTFDYGERIAAAYAQYSDHFGRWGLVAGLRAEYTRSRISTAEQKFFRHDTGLFPNIAVSYLLDRNKGHRLTADIGRGISRPDMASLNPNTDYSSVDFYSKGNPCLRASSRNYATLRTVWSNRYNLSVSYGFTDRAAAGIVRMDEAGVLYSMPENLASHRYVQANFGSSWNPFRGFMLNGDLSYRHERDRYDGQLYIYNTAELMVNILYNLPHGFRAGAGLIWASRSGSGNSLTEASRPLLGLTLSKGVLQRRLLLSLACRNILSSGRSRSTSDEPAFYRSTRNLLSGPTVSFTASYNFKWGNKKIKIQHAAAEDSESPRL